MFLHTHDATEVETAFCNHCRKFVHFYSQTYTMDRVIQVLGMDAACQQSGFDLLCKKCKKEIVKFRAPESKKMYFVRKEDE